MRWDLIRQVVKICIINDKPVEFKKKYYWDKQLFVRWTMTAEIEGETRGEPETDIKRQERWNRERAPEISPWFKRLHIKKQRLQYNIMSYIFLPIVYDSY